MTDEEPVTADRQTSIVEQPEESLLQLDVHNTEAEIEYPQSGKLFPYISSGLKLENPEPSTYSKATGLAREEIQSQMVALLDRSRSRDEMFPDFQLKFSPGRDFVDVYTDEISTLFPRADADLRKLLKQFVRVFRDGYFVKTLLKRILFAISIPLLLFFSLNLNEIVTAYLKEPLATFGIDDHSSWLVLSIALIPTYVIYRLLSGFLDERYKTTLQQSCTAVSQSILLRLSALAGCLDNIQIAIRDLYDTTEDKWVKESDYLMGLMVWLPVRVLHIEHYFQLTTWEIRRWFWAVQYFAVFTHVPILICFLYLLWAEVSLLDPVVEDLGRLPLTVAVSLLAFFTFREGSTNIQFVKDNIPINQWATFGAIQVDQAIAGIVGFLIKKFIMLRDVGKSGK